MMLRIERMAGGGLMNRGEPSRSGAAEQAKELYQRNGPIRPILDSPPDGP
jgi:hypothetical protein